MSNYLKRLNDLENPLPTDSPLFLPERPDNPAEEYVADRKTFKAKPLTLEEKNDLRDQYYENTKQEATETYDTFSCDSVTEVLDGKGWVVPNLLNSVECEEIIKLGEDWKQIFVSV